MKENTPAPAIPDGSRYYTFASALEGISFLILVLVAMPLKYMWGLPSFTRITGGIHGLLFLIVLLFWVQLVRDRQWGARKSLMILLVSCLPFGFFWVDRQIRRN